MRRLLKRRSLRKELEKANVICLKPEREEASDDRSDSDYSSIAAEPPAFLRFHGEGDVHSDDVSSIHESVAENQPQDEKLASSTSELDRLLAIPEDDEVSMMGESAKMVAVLKQRRTSKQTATRKCISSSHTFDSALASESDVNTNATTVPSNNFKRIEQNPFSSLVYIVLLMPSTPNNRTFDEPSVQSHEAMASEEHYQHLEQALQPMTNVIEKSIKWHLEVITDPEEQGDPLVDTKRSLPVRVDDNSLLVKHDENVLLVVDAVVHSHLKKQEFQMALETFESLLHDLRRKNANPSLITPLLDRLSTVCLFAGKSEKGLSYSNEVLQRPDTNKHSELVARIQQGLIYFGMGDLNNSLMSWREATYKVGTNFLMAALLWNNMACLQLYMGDFESAERYLKESIALQKQHQGIPSHFRKDLLNTATTLSNLAIVQSIQQHYDAAIPYLQESLLLQESVLSDENGSITLTIEHLNFLVASELQTRQHGSLVEKTSTEIMSGLPRLSGSVLFDDGLPLPKANNQQYPLGDHMDLGSLVHQIGPYQIVRDTIMESFTTLTPSQLTFVPATQTPRFSMPIDVDGNEVVNAEMYLPQILTQALEHLERNEVDDALELLKGTLRSHRQKYGSLHPLVAVALHNLGMVMLFSEKYTAAFTYFQHAVSIRSASLGFEHPDVAMSLTKMALIQTARKDFDNAIMIFSQVLRARRKTLGYNHPEVAKTLSNMACIHYECGGLLPASKALEESIEILRNISFAGAISIQSALATVLCNFGFVLVKRRKFDDAARAYNEALSLRLRRGQSNCQSISVTRDNLAYAKSFFRTLEANPRQDGALVDIAKMIEPYLDNMRCT